MDTVALLAHALRQVALPYLATRVFILAVSLAALAAWGIDPIEAERNFGGAAPATGPLDVFVRYDAAWYLAIARVGFTGPIESSYDMRAGWFPLFPGLIAAATAVIPHPVVAGLVVANLACLVFLVIFWIIVREDLGETLAVRSVWVLLLYPSSFFLTGVYSETTMLAAIAAGWLAVRRRRWWWAGIAMALASLTRPVGILGLIPVFAEIWRARAEGTSTVGHLAKAVLPVAVALAAYLAFATRWFGHPLAFVELQGWYRGPMSWPWQGFVRWWTEGPAWHGYSNSTLDAATALGALAMAAVVWRRWRWDYGLYCLVAVAVPLSSGLVSFSRLVLAAFPLAAAIALTMERRALRIAVALTSLLFLGVLAARFATWRWVA